MGLDLIIRNARLVDGADGAAADALVDIGVHGGRIAVIQAGLSAQGRELDVGGRLVAPGFVETHIHLDKSRIIDRCAPEAGRLANSVKRVAEVKKTFTVEDVHERAAKTLEGYGIAQGNPADMVVLDCQSPEQAVAEVAVPLHGFKRGRQVFTRAPARLHPPG